MTTGSRHTMTLSERLHHVGIAVSDLETSLQWYRQKLDFAVEKRFTLEEAHVEIVKLISRGGVRVELLKSTANDALGEGDDGVVTPRAKHICFEVDDIEAAAEELRRRGIQLVQEPKVIEASREKNCWIVDHEGNMIEFIEEMTEDASGG